MPFFQGAYNFTINNANMVDATGGTISNNITYIPLKDPWALSTQREILTQLKHLENVDDLPDPNIDGVWPFSKRATAAGAAEGEGAEKTNDKPKELTWWQDISLKLQSYLRQIYLLLLLRVPSLYLTRFNQIVDEASMTLGEMKDLALRAVATETIIDIEVPNPQDPEPHRLPPSYRRLKDRWETFIDILIKEWTTLNIVSALLVPGVLTMFQIAGGAAADPVTRYLSFWSLLSALLSLLYGCMFIVRFSRMRKTYIIIEWTMALRHQGLSSVFWNVPVMLAMPVLWLTWSIIIFIVCIMWFMWRVGTPPPDGTMVFSASPNTALGFRIFLCVTLGIGLFYGGLILFTFNKYGEGLDKKWKVHLTGLLAEAQDKQKSQTQTPGANSRTPSSSSQAFASQNLSSLQYNQHPGTNSRLLAPQARRRNPQGQHESPSRTPSPNRSNQHSTIDPTNYDMA